MNINQASGLRFYELDILRFLAALAVVFFHYTFLNKTQYAALPDYTYLSGVFKYGYLGVELFFIISGFVILLTTSNKTATEFTISRIARLYPAFWVAVSLTALVLWLAASGEKSVSLTQYLANMTMMPEYLGVQNIDSVYWTLQIEIKFYFWIFVLMFFNKIHLIERFIFIWLVLACLETFHFFHGFTHKFLIPEWAPLFSAGALFYRIRVFGFNWKRGALLAAAYILALYFAIQGAVERTEIYSSSFSPFIVAVIITAYFLIFTFIATEDARHFKRPWFVMLGALTYPLYLIHDAIGQQLFLYAQGVNKYAVLLGVIVLMLILSFLIYYFLEKKMARNIKQFLSARLLGNQTRNMTLGAKKAP